MMLGRLLCSSAGLLGRCSPVLLGKHIRPEKLPAAPYFGDLSVGHTSQRTQEPRGCSRFCVVLTHFVARGGIDGGRFCGSKSWCRTYRTPVDSVAASILPTPLRTLVVVSETDLTRIDTRLTMALVA